MKLFITIAIATVVDKLIINKLTPEKRRFQGLEQTMIAGRTREGIQESTSNILYMHITCMTTYDRVQAILN